MSAPIFGVLTWAVRPSTLMSRSRDTSPTDRLVDRPDVAKVCVCPDVVATDQYPVALTDVVPVPAWVNPASPGVSMGANVPSQPCWYSSAVVAALIGIVIVEYPPRYSSPIAY